MLPEKILDACPAIQATLLPSISVFKCTMVSPRSSTRQESNTHTHSQREREGARGSAIEREGVRERETERREGEREGGRERECVSDAKKCEIPHGQDLRVLHLACLCVVTRTASSFPTTTSSHCLLQVPVYLQSHFSATFPLCPELQPRLLT